MERKKEDRSLLIYILLSVVTCGIYGLIFMWSFTNDLNDVSSAKDPDGWRSPNFIIVILLTIVTCGIYSWYWLYKVGNTIQRSGDDYGEEKNIHFGRFYQYLCRLYTRRSCLL